MGGRGTRRAWRSAVLCAVALTGACRSRCSGSAAAPDAASPPEAAAPGAPPPSAAVGDAGAVSDASAASTTPPATVMVAADSVLSFDGKGRTLRVIHGTIRIYDADTMKLEAEHDAGGETAAVARDVILVEEPSEGEGGRPKHFLVDVPSGKRALLPGSWFIDPDDANGKTPSLSERGDRLAVVGGGIGRLTAVVYDTNTRRQIGTVSADLGTPAGGTFGGELTADGRRIKWCHSRAGTCTVTNLDGGAEPRAARYSVSSSKWTIDIPLDWDKQQVQPLRVRDESGAIVGKLAVPIAGGEQDGPLAYGIAICAGADRAVVVRSPHLYVVRLPDGKRLVTQDLDASAEAVPIVACSPGATRYALALLEGGEAATLIVKALPPEARK